MKHLLIILFLIPLTSGAQIPEDPNQVPNNYWAWSASEYTRPGVDLLIAYKVKEAYGARITFGSVVVNTTALYPDAPGDQMLNDLIATLGKKGLLANIKGLDNPRRASITILSYEQIRTKFIYSTEQLQTSAPN